jgi:hypothetical protein
VKSFNEVNSITSKDKLQLSGEPYTIPLERTLALRIYADSRPHNLEISQLQKGLILMLGERELIEEGVGFGVPVAMFSDKTYFSGSATVSIPSGCQKKVVVQQFYMDTVSRKIWKNKVFADNSVYQLFSRFLMGIYRKYPASRRGIFPLIKLRNRLGIQTRFTKAKHRGTITVTYKIKRNSVVIEADLTKIDKHNCTKVLLLNEQGSTFFRRFHDSNGTSLTDEKIGAWDVVDADWAWFSDINYTLGFRLQRLPPYKLMRGREYIKDRLSWAGMAYELNPHTGYFQYEVKILRGERKKWSK